MSKIAHIVLARQKSIVPTKLTQQHLSHTQIMVQQIKIFKKTRMFKEKRKRSKHIVNFQKYSTGSTPHLKA